MTNEEIDKMEAGPEMDARMAEIMGWHVVHCHNFDITKLDIIPYKPHLVRWHNGSCSLYRPLDNECHGWSMDEQWSPSTNIAAAWEVVEEFDYNEMCGPSGDEWTYYLEKDSGEYGEARTNTVPLAICRAALKAANYTGDKADDGDDT